MSTIKRSIIKKGQLSPMTKAKLIQSTTGLKINENFDVDQNCVLASPYRAMAAFAWSNLATMSQWVGPERSCPLVSDVSCMISNEFNEEKKYFFFLFRNDGRTMKVQKSPKSLDVNSYISAEIWRLEGLDWPRSSHVHLFHTRWFIWAINSIFIEDRLFRSTAFGSR